MPIILESPSASGGGGSGTVTNVSSANSGIAVANPTTTPTLTLATLDVIAADGPPAANWSNNSKKITSLANGAGAQDAAAFGQIPTALPPNGAAGGDLAGTYPNPAVKAITETSGPTDLVIGTITDGQVLKRVGGTLVSVAAGAGTVTNVSSPNTSIVVTNPTTTPALAVGTLDVLAANGPAAANWSNNSHKITAVTRGGAANEAATFDQIPLASGAFLRGAKVQSFSRGYVAVALAITSGTLYLELMQLVAGTGYTSVTFASAGTSLAAGTHQIFGIFDDDQGSSSGTAYGLLAQTNDDTSTAWSSNTVKTLNLTGTFTPTRTGIFYIGVLVAAGTTPSLQSLGSLSSAPLAFTPAVAASANTGLTALPNPATGVSALSGNMIFTAAS